MENIKEKAIGLINKRVLVKAGVFALFLAISMAAPFLKQQFIAGPIVNAVLFISTVVLGAGAGALIAFLPSMISVFTGLLPLPLLPMVPYIIMGNVILVLIFGSLRKKNFWLGVLSASVLKFIFLFLASSFIVNLFIKESLPPKIIAMMAWPQLITALAGGIIAWAFLEKFKKLKKL